MEDNKQENVSSANDPVLEVTEIDIIEEVIAVPETSAAAAASRRKPWTAAWAWIVAHRALSIVIAAIIVVLALLWIFKGCFVAATVNGSPLARMAVTRELERSSGQAVLESLVKEELIRQEASKRGVNVTAADIDEKIKQAEDSLSAQGVTLDQALAEQGLDRTVLRSRIETQVMLEKIIGDTLNVTDEEIAAYIKENSVTLPKGQEDVVKAGIKDALRNAKLNEEASKLVDDLMSKANVDYWVKY